MAAASAFAPLSDDIVLTIFAKLESDPRDWARLACVSPRFAALLRNICCRAKCSRAIPSVVSDLVISTSAGEPPGGWAALHKLAVCCPGLLHAGVLFENSDFGLERDIGPDEVYRRRSPAPPPPPPAVSVPDAPPCCWSLFDDLYLDAAYDAAASEAGSPSVAATAGSRGGGGGGSTPIQLRQPQERPISEKQRRKRRCARPVESHLASGGLWSLSREQGNKLLASRFRGDSLYICDWPGCVHAEERRSYMLFRGVFKDFRRSGVWRAIHDANRSRSGIPCAFCACLNTWDLHSSFCLRRVFGFHDDGDPVVRAYVCDNGHVSGAWTERPMYS